MKAVQQILADLGYAPGPVDGALGGATTRAISAFQRDRKIAETGRISARAAARAQARHRARPDQDGRGALSSAPSPSHARQERDLGQGVSAPLPGRGRSRRDRAARGRGRGRHFHLRRRLDGTVSLYGPAPAGLTESETERRWVSCFGSRPVSEAEADIYLARQQRVRPRPLDHRDRGQGGAALPRRCCGRGVKGSLERGARLGVR